MEAKTKNTIIALSVLGLVALVAMNVIKKQNQKSRMGDGDTGGGGGGVDDTGGGNDGGGGNTGSGNLSNAQITKIADDIFNAMDGYGTNEQDIVDSFKKLRTNDDFNALVQAFGTRTISSGAGNIFQSDFNGNLRECLYDELSDSWIEQINNVLRNNGISSRF